MSKVVHPPIEVGRRERRKRATRADLLLAGRRLFSEKGLFEARIEDLTQDAGIAKGTLYTYFQDKDELVRAVARGGFLELHGAVARRIGRAKRADDVLRRALRAHLEFFLDHPDLMRILQQVRGMLMFNRPEARPLRATLEDYLHALAETLAASPVLAALAVAERTEIARLLFGAVSGVTSVEITATSRPPSRPMQMRLEECLLAMARRRVELAGHGRGSAPRQRTARARRSVAGARA
jgi:AcrR family transcriptional regulator